MKYFDIKRYKFSTILKSIQPIRENCLKIYKKSKLILTYLKDLFILFIKYVFKIIYKNVLDLTYSFIKIIKKFIKVQILKILKILKNYKYFNFKKFFFLIIYKYINIKKYKFIIPYFIGSLISLAIIYVTLPIFFNYEKSAIENVICKDLNIQCKIKSKIKYSFYPSPRIKFKNLVINDFFEPDKILGEVENVEVKISYYNLLNKKKFNFTNIKLKNAKLNLNLKKISDYKVFFSKKFKSKPISFKDSEINFFDATNHIASIKNAFLEYKFKKKTDQITLKGRFLGDNIFISLKNNKSEENQSLIYVLKFLNSKINTKGKIVYSEKKNDPINGNIVIKKNKNMVTAIFDIKDGKIIIKNSNFKNIFLDGKFDGEINFLPYFDFNLNVDINGVNFNKFYTFLINLDEKDRLNLFKINKKLNGKFNLSINKIYSRHTFVDSLESQLKFINGNILVEQMLLNLKKLGAADVTGTIKTGNKYTNFSFEHNIFLDNLKRFYSGFGIYNRQKVASHLFVSGNFNLTNLNLRLNEIFVGEKLNKEELIYIEKNFNDIMLQNYYKSLFDYKKLKEFIQLISGE